MTERPNRDIALRYWNDLTLKAWYWNIHTERWILRLTPNFDESVTWHVGHEAPTELPVKMCELAGIRFPPPMREAPPHGSKIWIASVTGVYVYSWAGWTSDVNALAARVCHTTKAAAQAHHLALAAANLQAIEGAK